MIPSKSLKGKVKDGLLVNYLSISECKTLILLENECTTAVAGAPPRSRRDSGAEGRGLEAPGQMIEWKRIDRLEKRVKLIKH